VREKDLRILLLEQPLPDEHIAEERAWDAVRAAFLARERLPRERRVPWRLLIALAIIGGGIAIGVSPAGSEVADWVRDKLGRDRVVEAEPAAPPAVAPLPAPGRLLVAAANGVWVVNEDGDKRRLGDYAGATWSPNGLFVGAWTERELVAIDPTVTDGSLHWTVSQPGITEARWAPSGFRVAYLAGDAIRVVIGNGENDRELASPVAPAAPAWRPGSQNVVAYADPQGRVLAVDVDSGEALFRTARAPVPIALDWASDGRQLVVLSEQLLRVFRAPRELVSSLRIPKRLYRATALAARPGSGEVAYSVYSARTGQGTVFLYNGRFSRPLFSGGGRFDDLVWSPDGQLLLVPWAAADQWLYIPMETGGAVQSRADVTRQFDPGGTAAAAFPRVEGWLGDGDAETGTGADAGSTGATDTGLADTGTGESAP
jgi:hypothetical protein